MTKEEKANIKKWVETWKSAGPVLEKIKREELLNFDYSKNRHIIDEMLQWACDHAEPRQTSGLVEQQRLFKKLKEKLDMQGKI